MPSSRASLLSLAMLCATAAPASAQSDAWVVEVTASGGSLDASAAQPVIEAARAEIAACAPDAGEHRFVYVVSLRANGQVREATYDRGATADARGARCIRHALLLLRFPAHDAAATLALTLHTGASAPPVTTAPPPTSAPPVTGAPPPTSAPPVATAPSRSASSVTLGAIAGTTDRPAAAVIAAVTTHLASVTACYEAARAADATLAGDGVVQLGVAADGHVTSALFQGSEALAGALAICISQAVRSWSFGPAPAEARIAVPLTFGAVSRPVRQ